MKLPPFLKEPPNFFDPVHVHGDLENHKGLWESVTYMHNHIGTYGDPESQIKVTYYFLVPKLGMEDQLIKLAVGWDPGKMEWVTKQGARSTGFPFPWRSNHPPKILKITWAV